MSIRGSGSLIPGVGLGRFPVKLFVLGAFAVPVLAAYALASLQSDREGRDRKKLEHIVAMWGEGLSWRVWVSSGLVGRHPFPFDQWDLTLRNFMVRAVALLAGLALLWLASCLEDRNTQNRSPAWVSLPWSGWT